MVIGGHGARGIGANAVILQGVELGDDCIAEQGQSWQNHSNPDPWSVAIQLS